MTSLRVHLATAVLLMTAVACGDDSAPTATPATPDKPSPEGAAGSASESAAVTGQQQDVMGVPCDVASVVSSNCTGCHAGQAKFGAPMPLMSHADFIAPAKSDPSRKVFEVTPERINASDVARRMPPASTAALKSPDLKRFSAWLEGGAKAVSPSCAITEKSVGGEDEASGGDVMAGMGPGSGGATSVKQEYDDPELKCYEFRAHAPGDKDKPFSVGTQPDMYTNFTFMPPWQGKAYARSFRVLSGNDAVIHHWLFYKNNTAGTDGDVAGSIGAHPEGELVHGWAPGGSDLYFDSDVGLEMPGNVAYVLETHHNNTGTDAQDDGSGLEVCVTPNAPTHVASLSWLGTDAISGTSASGSCDPISEKPIQIIGVQPHMHLKGNHMTAEITRADGSKQMLHDMPFDFQYQRSYDVRTTLMPGDTIKTTCSYSEPARFGEGTQDEMCYIFTMYYPKLSLTNNNPIASLIHGPNTCLQ